jgi:WD40 repeat protein
VWNAQTMTPMMAAKTMGGDVLSLMTFAGKDNYADPQRPAMLFAGMVGGEIRALALPAFQDAGQVNRGGVGHYKPVNDLQKGPDGHFLSGSADGNVAVWQYQQQPPGQA